MLMKNAILNLITGIMICIMILSMCAVDSRPIVACIGLVVSLAWIAVFAYVNGYICGFRK